MNVKGFCGLGDRKCQTLEVSKVGLIDLLLLKKMLVLVSVDHTRMNGLYASKELDFVSYVTPDFVVTHN